MVNKEKNIIIVMAVCFMVICSSLLVTARDLRGSDALNLRNATDSLILLVELATESSENYIQAKADHIEMLGKYVKHMENRHKPWAFVLKNDITVELKLAIKKLGEDEKEANQQAEAIAKIKIASKTIAEFLDKHKLLMDEPVVGSEFEVVSKEMQTTIRKLLDEAHKKTQAYIDDLNMINSEVAYRANRKVMVYLYLVRFEWFGLKIDAWKEFRNFRGDINRTIYWNRLLMKRSGITEKERLRLTKCSANELRHLRLLHAIIDDDMREAHSWLKIAIKEAFPDVQFLAEK